MLTAVSERLSDMLPLEIAPGIAQTLMIFNLHLAGNGINPRQLWMSMSHYDSV